MKTICIIQNTFISAFKLFTSTCTNDLVVHAKQVNYFEMFIIAFAIELKTSVSSNLNYSVSFLKILQ